MPSPPLFQGEKGEPGPVFSPDGGTLGPAQKGAKVSPVPGIAHLCPGWGRGGGGVLRGLWKLL